MRPGRPLSRASCCGTAAPAAGPAAPTRARLGRVRSHWMGGQTAGLTPFSISAWKPTRLLAWMRNQIGADAERRRRSLKRRQELCDRGRRARDQQPNSEPVAKFPHDPVDPRRFCRSGLVLLSADRSDATKATRRTSCGKAQLRASRYTPPRSVGRTSPHPMTLLLRPRRLDAGQAKDLRVASAGEAERRASPGTRASFKSARRLA